MQAKKFLPAAVFAAAIGAGAVQGRPLISDNGPAEFPPPGYAGNQYVDSRGCVYIRAGYAGQVDWIPRVTRGREVVCGYRPTLAVKSAAAAPGPEIAAPAPKPEAPRVPPKRPAAEAAAASSACGGRKILSARYVRDGSAIAVRCAAAPETAAAPAPLAVTVGDPPGAEAPMTFAMPAGYERAWSDGRLNTRRGMGTAAGQAAMERVWTNSVPRRLIDAGTGASRRQALLVQPYGGSAAPAAQPRISTKAAPAAAGQGAGPRFVQVGAYGEEANMRAAIARMQRLGLPVSTARRKSGSGPSLVLAGPFTSAGELKSALGAIRKAGYRDAFAR